MASCHVFTKALTDEEVKDRYNADVNNTSSDITAESDETLLWYDADQYRIQYKEDKPEPEDPDEPSEPSEPSEPTDPAGPSEPETPSVRETDFGKTLDLQIGEIRRLVLSTEDTCLQGVSYVLDRKGSRCLNVRNGVVTARKEGTAELTVVQNGKELGKINFNVKDLITPADIAKANNPADGKVKVDAIVRLKYTGIAGKDAQKSVKVRGTKKVKGGKVVSAVSSDEKVCKVALKNENTSQYTLTALGQGVAYVTWTLEKNGVQVKGLTKVIITRPVQNGELVITSDRIKAENGRKVLTLDPGRTEHLEAVIPSDCTDNTPLKWKSMSSDVRVSSDGCIIAAKPSRRDTAVEVSMGSIKDKVFVRINPAAKWIAMDKPQYTKKHHEGKTATVSFRVKTRDKALAKNLKWSVQEGPESGITFADPAKGRATVGKDTKPGVYHIVCKAVDDSTVFTETELVIR
jgi:hypothetical protein